MLPQWRPIFLRLGGVKCGRSVIYGNVRFDAVCPELIQIGNHVAITSGARILTHFFDPNTPGVYFKRGKVIIEDDVFIGLNVVICSSVRIGRGAVVGAGSIVTKDIPPYEVWAGNPAHLIKKRVH